MHERNVRNLPLDLAAGLAKAVVEMVQLDRRRVGLACHGTKASPPALVKENDSDDKPVDFKVGDLRGMDAVFIAEVQQAHGTLQETSG